MMQEYRKRKRSDVVPAAAAWNASLAFRALAVVLQHWMIPNLGWDITHLKGRLLKAKKCILSYRENVMKTDDTDIMEHRLRVEVGCFDERMLQHCINRARSLRLESELERMCLVVSTTFGIDVSFVYSLRCRDRKFLKWNPLVTQQVLHQLTKYYICNIQWKMRSRLVSIPIGCRVQKSLFT